MTDVRGAEDGSALRRPSHPSCRGLGPQQGPAGPTALTGRCPGGAAPLSPRGPHLNVHPQPVACTRSHWRLHLRNPTPGRGPRRRNSGCRMGKTLQVPACTPRGTTTVWGRASSAGLGCAGPARCGEGSGPCRVPGATSTPRDAPPDGVFVRPMSGRAESVHVAGCGVGARARIAVTSPGRRPSANAQPRRHDQPRRSPGRRGSGGLPRRPHVPPSPGAHGHFPRPRSRDRGEH